MNNDFINLVYSIDMIGQPLLNMRIAVPEPIRATEVIDAPVRATEPREYTDDYKPTTLAEFDTLTTLEDPITKRGAFWILSEIRNFESERADKYYITYNQYSDSEININVATINNPTDEMIQRFSFSISIYPHPDFGKSVKLYINGLYVNKKYNDVGTTLLSIAKRGMISMVTLGQLNYGSVELGSVDSAVMFYIKNGFVIADLFNTDNPQSKVYSTQRMLEFAIRENNVKIMQLYAKLNADNFLEFVTYLLEKTKYGRFFEVYIEALEADSTIEESIMKSKFISSLFNTHMIFRYVRSGIAPKINLKPLTRI